MYTLLWSLDTILSYATAMFGRLDRLVCSLLFDDGHIIFYAWDVYQFVDIFGCRGFYALQLWMIYSIWLLTFIYAFTHCILEC